jgi:hypothetical protein
MVRLRLGIAAATTALLASLGGVSACGSLASNAAFAGGSSGGGDSGEQSDATSDVTSFSDAPADAPAEAADAAADAMEAPPGAILVHASPSLRDLVFCWSVGSDAGLSMTATPYPWGTPMPASNYPGVPVGGAVGLADASSMMGGDLSVVAFDAKVIAQALNGVDCSASNTCSCNALMNNPAVDISDIHHMPVIPGGAIVPGATVVLWVHGCFGTNDDPKASVQRCGSDWTPATGNLRMDLASIPGASLPPPDAGIFAVQAAQLSPALAVLAGSTPVVVSYGTQGAADASVVTSLSTPGQILPNAPLQVATNIPLASFGQLGFAVDVVNDAGGAHLWMSLARSLDLVDPTQNPAQYFAQPTSYLVAAVGDPAATPPDTDAAYDGTGLHLLVLPLP